AVRQIPGPCGFGKLRERSYRCCGKPSDERVLLSPYLLPFSVRKQCWESPPNAASSRFGDFAELELDCEGGPIPAKRVARPGNLHPQDDELVFHRPAPYRRRCRPNSTESLAFENRTE